MQKKAFVLALMGAALVFGGALSSFAQSKMGLPDASSGIPYNDLRFPEDKWSPELLKAIEGGPAYLKKDEVFNIDPAPANDSETTKADIEQVLKFQKEERDEKTVALILEENGKDPFIPIFTRPALFSIAKENKATHDLLIDTISETGFFILREKQRFQRARPTQLAPDLTLVIDVPPHSSYPSGHAGQVYAAALVLSKLDPENKDRYLQLAIDVGHRREIAGVHYPSDGAAGRKLAEQVIEKLLAEPEYQAQFQHAKETFVKQQPTISE